MARKRIIDPEFWSDEEIGAWSPLARLFYIGLWNFADDEGRIKAHPVLLRAQIFPYDTRISISKLKEEIGLKVQWYEVDGSQYGYIKNFLKYQRIDRPSQSKLPTPPSLLDGGSTNNRRGLAPNIIEVNISKDKGTRKTFIEPSIEEIQQYCQERKNRVDPEQFHNHYESNGWMVGKSKMKDWRAAVRTWEKNSNKPLITKRPLSPIDLITNIDKAVRLIEKERTTSAMIQCLKELPEKDRQDFVEWLHEESQAYLLPVYERSRKLFKGD
jgi:hypothetical protein